MAVHMACHAASRRIELLADRECAFSLRATFSGGGMRHVSVDVPVNVGPSLGLSRSAGYVPEPRPLARGKYEIGAFYFCDWVRPEQWMKICLFSARSMFLYRAVHSLVCCTIVGKRKGASDTSWRAQFPRIFRDPSAASMVSKSAEGVKGSRRDMNLAGWTV